MITPGRFSMIIKSECGSYVCILNLPMPYALFSEGKCIVAKGRRQNMQYIVNYVCAYAYCNVTVTSISDLYQWNMLI